MVIDFEKINNYYIFALVKRAWLVSTSLRIHCFFSIPLANDLILGLPDFLKLKAEQKIFDSPTLNNLLKIFL